YACYRILSESCYFLAGIIIASPLPDEIGIALLGFMKTRKKDFFLLSLVANFLGILAIGLVAREW
ncbi:MAG: hypothetical protein AAB538_04290, partial [Patescibacteria group bacterium]